MSSRRNRAAAFSLVELMVAIAIIAILATVVLFGTRAARNYMRMHNARQQLELIRTAINEYAANWPRWEEKFTSVVIAEQGWPDFIPSRLFASPPFQNTSPFNDPTPAGLTFDLVGGDSGLDTSNPDGDIISEGDIEYAAETLLYGLTQATGKGPFLTDKMSGDLQTAHEDELYPTLVAGAGSRPRGELLDPWGTPYRYFWVYRDPEPGGSSTRSYRGYLPVRYGAIVAGTGLGGVGNNAFYHVSSTGQQFPMTAAGYVLESAGPDKKFGNVWKANPLQQEIEEAADNLIVAP